MKRGPYTKTRTLLPPNPTGICQCGECGLTTSRAKMSNVAIGNIAGEYVRFIYKHRRPGRRALYARAKAIPIPNPSGICQCGECGRKTKRAKQSNAVRGWVIGEYMPFIHNHHGKSAIQYAVEDRGYKTPCWIWQLAVRKGYGTMSDDGYTRSAHRVYYKRAKGAIPDGYEVDHLCHVTKCVNPEHLEAVPPITNQRRKLRTRLSEELAIMIRLSTKKSRVIARELGVCASTIIAVRNGKTWVGVNNAPPTVKPTN